MKIRVQSRKKIITFWSLILLSLGLACGKKVSDQYEIQIPWQTGDSYALQFVPVGFTDLRHMQGPDAVFFDEPTLFENEDPRKSQVVGKGAMGKFISLAGNRFVPASYNTLFLSTVYAHIERLNKFLREIGHDKILDLPMKVGINPKNIEFKPNNAIYHSSFDGIFIYPFYQSGLPLAFNGGVMAHEYFHAIYDHAFQRHVIKSLAGTGVVDPLHGESHFAEAKLKLSQRDATRVESCRNEQEIPALYNLFVLRAMNEGLADVWAWIYTNDTDFILHSFGKRLSGRVMRGNILSVPTSKMVHDSYVNYLREYSCDIKQAVNSLFDSVYIQGTNLSRFVVSFAKAGKIERPELAKMIVETLKKMPDVSYTENRTLNVTFKSFVDVFVSKAKTVSPDQCEMIKKLIPDNTQQPANGVATCVR